MLELRSSGKNAVMKGAEVSEPTVAVTDIDAGSPIDSSESPSASGFNCTVSVSMPADRPSIEEHTR